MKCTMYKRGYAMLGLVAALMFVLPAAVMAGSEEWLIGKHKGGAQAVAFFNDGVRLASGGGDMKVKIWDVRTGARLFSRQRHTNTVYSLALSPDNKLLASGGVDNLIIMWDTETMSVLSKKDTGATVIGLTFSPDGKTLAAGGSDNAIRFYAVDNGKLLATKTLNKHTDDVWSVAFSPDGLFFASGSADDTVKVWNVSQGVENITCLKTFKKHTSDVTGVAFFPDGRLVSASQDGTVRMYDLVTMQQVAVGSPPVDIDWPAFDSMTVSPDGNWVAGGGDDGYAVTWFERNGDQLVYRGMAQVNGDDEGSLSFSPDSSELATASTDGTIKVIPTGLIYPLN